MSDPLAALLHSEWDRRLCEPSEPGVPCSDCIDSAARLIAAGVTLAPSVPAAPLCDRCGKRPRVESHYGLCCECIVPFDNECHPSDPTAPLTVERLARALTEVQGGAYGSWLRRAPLILAALREGAAS